MRILRLYKLGDTNIVMILDYRSKIITISGLASYFYQTFGDNLRPNKIEEPIELGYGLMINPTDDFRTVQITISTALSKGYKAQYEFDYSELKDFSIDLGSISIPKNTISIKKGNLRFKLTNLVESCVRPNCYAWDVTYLCEGFKLEKAPKIPTNVCNLSYGGFDIVYTSGRKYKIDFRNIKMPQFRYIKSYRSEVITDLCNYLSHVLLYDDIVDLSHWSFTGAIYIQSSFNFRSRADILFVYLPNVNTTGEIKQLQNSFFIDINGVVVFIGKRGAIEFHRATQVLDYLIEQTGCIPLEGVNFQGISDVKSAEQELRKRIVHNMLLGVQAKYCYIEV